MRLINHQVGKYYQMVGSFRSVKDLPFSWVLQYFLYFDTMMIILDGCPVQCFRVLCGFWINCLTMPWTKSHACIGVLSKLFHICVDNFVLWLFLGFMEAKLITCCSIHNGSWDALIRVFFFLPWAFLYSVHKKKYMFFTVFHLEILNARMQHHVE